MNAYPLAPAFLLNSAAAGLLVLIVLAVQWLFRRQLSPAWRCALWLVVIARLVLPVSIGSPVSLMHWLPRPVAPADHSAIPARTLPRLAWAEITPENPLPTVPLSLDRAATTATANRPPAMVDSQPSPASSPVSLATLVFWIWLAGLTGLGANVAWSARRLHRRLRTCRPVTDPATLERLDACAAALGVRRVPPVAECPGLASPALHGFLRPRLLLPARFTTDFSVNEQRLVFLHEMAHLRRHDLPLNWLVTALQVLHWFNPLLWVGFARWRADREVACDALALEAAGAEQSQAYGRTILHLLEQNGPQIAEGGLVGILEDRRQLRQRLEMISGFVPGRRGTLLALSLLGGMIAVGLTDARSADSTASASSASSAAPAPAGETAKRTQPRWGRNLNIVGARSVAANPVSGPEARPASGSDVRIFAIEYQDPNGQWQRTKWGGPNAIRMTKRRIVRLNSDGTVDSTFTPVGPPFPMSGIVDRQQIRTDGTVYLDGRFESADGQNLPALASVNAAAPAPAAVPPSVMPFTPAPSQPLAAPPVTGGGAVDDGGRRVLSVSEVPPQYTVVNRAFIDALGITNLQEATKLAPAQTFRKDVAIGRLAFIVDTSGSMRDPNGDYNLYAVIGDLVEEELNLQSGIREFALLNSDGGAILGTNENPWLPNDVASRRQANLTLKDYKTLSQSNPVPGIITALARPTNPGDGNSRLSICVIGDEVTVAAAPVIQRLEELNSADGQGNRRATISAIQLPTALGNPDLVDQTTGIAFRDLMTALTKAHGGTYRLLASLAVRGPATGRQNGTGIDDAPSGRAALGRDTFSVDFPNEDIRSILRNVADLFQLNIIIPQSLEGKTSIKLQNVTWQQVFRAVLDPVGYAFVEEGKIIRIAPKPAAASPAPAPKL